MITILACLVLRGKQTKSEIKGLLKDNYYADIINAFQKLELNDLIKKSGAKFGRGKPQYYYKITPKGLKLLIAVDPHPFKFWKILFGYYHHFGKGSDSDKIDDYFNLFVQKYLKYRNRSFSFLLGIFDNMSNQWLHDMILKTDNVSIAQKILEVLAIHKGITFEQLVEKTGGKASEVRQYLSIYTLESYRPIIDKTVYIHQNVTGKKYNKKYWDFLLHNAIIVNQNNKDHANTYELSLFGIVLVLTLIRYNDRDKLNNGLYYDNISFAEYYDNIVSNYHDKLPLIFGKWGLLKDILRLYSAYNFDIIVDKEIRTRESDKFSVIRGGNKELLDSVKEIVLQTRQQIEDFAKAGFTAWLNYVSAVSYEIIERKNHSEDYLLSNDIDVQRPPDLQKVSVVKKKLDEIQMLLNPLEYGFSGSFSLQPDEINKISNQLETLFANEITAFYYFHLHFEYEFNTRVGTPMKYYGSINQSQDKFPVSSVPKKCLMLIISKDKGKPSLKEWFNGYMQDVNNLQREIYEEFRSNS